MDKKKDLPYSDANISQEDSPNNLDELEFDLDGPSAYEVAKDDDNFWDKVKKVGQKLKQTAAGQTVVGKIIGRVKDVASDLGILPRWFNRATDTVGDSLKDESKHNNMSLIWKKLKEPSTWIGIIGFLGSIFSFSLSATLEQQIASALSAIVAVVATATKDGKRRKD